MKSFIPLLTGSNIFLTKFLRRIFFFAVFVLSTVAANAQTPETQAGPGSGDLKKAKLVLKPNSREEKVVMRDNKLMRINMQRNKAVLQKVHQMRQKRLMMLKNDRTKRQEMQRRKMIMQKRNNPRK